MRKILFLFSFVLININLFSQTPEELFRKANSAYQNNDYKTAIEAYRKLIDFGYGSGDMYFNLGNAYYRTGQFAPAILYYERAKILMPGDAELSHNLLIVNLRIQDKLEKVPKLFVLEWWDVVKNLFPVSFYQYLILLLFVILLSVTALFFWFKDYLTKKKLFLAIITTGIVFVFFTSAFVTRAIEIDNEQYAVLFQKSLKVKSSPDRGATDLFEIHYGIKFQIVDGLEGWVKILLIDGKTGWIEKSGFEII